MVFLLRQFADLALKIAAVAVLSALLATVILGVVSRALGEPVVFSDELARYLMVWLAFLGWILASRRRSHIRITVLIGLLPAGGRRLAEVIIQAGIMLFGVLLLRDGLTLVTRNLDVESVSLPVPSAIIYGPVVLAGLATALQAVEEIVALLSPAAKADAVAVSGGKIL
jgi:TRAP-type transport system small permease protein